MLVQESFPDETSLILIMNIRLKKEKLAFAVTVMFSM